MQRTPNTCIEKQMSHIAYPTVPKPCHVSCVKYPPSYTMNPKSQLEHPTSMLNPAYCIMHPPPCIPYRTFAPHANILRLASYLLPFMCFDIWITHCPNTLIGRKMNHKHTLQVARHALHINAARLMNHERRVTHYTSYTSSHQLES